MANQLTSQQWQPLSTTSKERLARIVTRMMAPADLNSRTPLVSPTEAADLIAAIEARGDATTSPALASASARTLMGLFPAKAFNDPEVFATGLAALLSAYDHEFVKAICSPVDGLPTRLKYAVSLADVKEALEAERRKRLSLLSRARWTLKEHERRAEEERERQAMPPEAIERRRRQVAALLGPRDLEQGEPLKIDTEREATGTETN